MGNGRGLFYLIARSSFGPRFMRISPPAIEMDRVLSIPQIVDIEWQDDLLWVLNGLEHTLEGYTQDGAFHTGPVDVYPPGWNQGVEWLDLEKSGPDLGLFFTGSAARNTVNYMQLEAGPLATPTPLPASGVPTGSTVAIEVVPSLPLEMVLIPKGTFQQGSPDNEVGRRRNEGPQHFSTLTYDFYISRCEITNALYQQFNRGFRPPRVGDADIGGASKPVVGISWEDATNFCLWLSNRTDYTFSLPYEAEWEYVCRAGTTARRPWGTDASDETTCLWANVADISSTTEYVLPAVFPCDDGTPGPANVGSYPANLFGVNDMMGNVTEWCQDWFGLYTSALLTNPTGPDRGSSRVIRGGSWQDGPSVVRSAYRGGLPPTQTSHLVGFRVVIRDTN